MAVIFLRTVMLELKIAVKNVMKQGEQNGYFQGEKRGPAGRA
jgi:hypothetical protein